MTGKKRNIYLAVIGLGLVGLIVDRLTGGSAPAAAQADIRPPDRSAAPEVTPTDAVLAVTVVPFPGVASLLSEPTAERDPFAPTEGVLAQWAAANAPAVEEGPETADRSAARGAAFDPERFAQEHTLSAVVLIGATRSAVIDGLSMSVGQQLEDCILTEVRPRVVEFSCPSGEIALSLEGGSRAAADE